MVVDPVNEPCQSCGSATLNIVNRNKLLLTGVLLGSALLVLSACSSDSDDGDAVSSETVSTAGTTAPAVTDVNPASFEMDGRYVFDVPMGDGTTSLCVMADSSITCSGKAPEDAPDITVEPFPTQPPGAITLDEDGLTWYMLEGVPPAPGKLEHSQRITHGGITCETDAEGTLDCALGDNGFTINHEDAAISLRGTVRVTAEAEAPEAEASSTKPTAVDGGVDGDYSSTDEPMGEGTWCGVAHPEETEAYVHKGSVGCLTAQEVIAEYRDRRMSEGGGNTLAMQVGEWNCSSPTAMSSQELSEEIFNGTIPVATVCDNPDGTRIAAAV
ncbi:Secreted protein OS=Corynebacterium variabile OX=1727 GN=CVA01_15940 PE=4 SV=1 [Corynebacterium variabile]